MAIARAPSTGQTAQTRQASRKSDLRSPDAPEPGPLRGPRDAVDNSQAAIAAGLPSQRPLRALRETLRVDTVVILS